MPETHPVVYSPHALNFSAVVPGDIRTDTVTIAKAPWPAMVTAKITDDTSAGYFRIGSLRVYEVDRVGGHPVDLTLVAESDGTTPVSSTALSSPARTFRCGGRMIE